MRLSSGTVMFPWPSGIRADEIDRRHPLRRPFPRPLPPPGKKAKTATGASSETAAELLFRWPSTPTPSSGAASLLLQSSPPTHKQKQKKVIFY